jgi:osmotically-inducible protein OsmY
MSANDELVADVTDELFWDPKVDATAIALSAHDGSITLRGTVGSLREKREAKNAAERVFGVLAVDNQLQVRFLNDEKRADAELRGDVLQALMLDSLVPKTVDAKATDGLVTLTGTVNWQYQRDEAELDADYLDVSTNNGTVTVTGTVRSWAEHDEVLDAAWAAPGVTSVRDDMTIAY